MKGDERLAAVIFPILNGHEFNNDPEQSPRQVHHQFFRLVTRKGTEYASAFQRVGDTRKSRARTKIIAPSTGSVVAILANRVGS